MPSDLRPQIVKKIDDTGHLGLSYERITPLLAGAVQQQQHSITDWESRKGRPGPGDGSEADDPRAGAKENPAVSVGGFVQEMRERKDTDPRVHPFLQEMCGSNVPICIPGTLNGSCPPSCRFKIASEEDRGDLLSLAAEYATRQGVLVESTLKALKRHPRGALSPENQRTDG